MEDVYLLFLNRPPDDVPADDGGATVVPAASLYHPELPQPDAQRLSERLTGHPDRYPGALLFLSDLTAELASEGLSWSQVGIDYEAVTDRLVALHHRGEVWALRLAQLSDLAVTLLASGPHTQVYVAAPMGGPPELLDPSIFQVRREELRAMIRADLEHRVTTGRYVVENCWPIPNADGPLRGVLVEGPVFSRRLGRWRAFRYEVRCWPDGSIADADRAVASPQRLSDDPAVARRMLELVGALPSPVWGRDQLRTGEMWNSNSVIAWLLARSGLPTDTIRPPAGGRAPGWQAGLAIARRSTMASPYPRANQTEGQDAHTTAVGAGGSPAPTARAS